AHIRNSNANG
ncbi:hypothetical protein D046_2879B, partial [Vibrio parahaemolyticus V-223/04]